MTNKESELFIKYSENEKHELAIAMKILDENDTIVLSDDSHTCNISDDWITSELYELIKKRIDNIDESIEYHKRLLKK